MERCCKYYMCEVFAVLHVISVCYSMFVRQVDVCRAKDYHFLEAISIWVEHMLWIFRFETSKFIMFCWYLCEHKMYEHLICMERTIAYDANGMASKHQHNWAKSTCMLCLNRKELFGCFRVYSKRKTTKHNTLNINTNEKTNYKE